MAQITKNYLITEDLAGQRLDKALSLLDLTYTRNYFSRLIEDGFVTVNSKKVKSSCILKINDVLEVIFPEPKSLDLKPVQINLDIIYEDKDLLVVNKAAGMVVHPGDKGVHSEDSLVNAILYHAGKDLSGIGGVARPGIVHRLDKDTSGLLVVAKSDLAHQHLVKQFKNREVEKTYYALVIGKIPNDKGFIDAEIGRSYSDRKKMSISPGGKFSNSKSAQTKFLVVERFSGAIGDFSLCKVKLITGRTHQIRVHFESIGHPLVGDRLYGDHKTNKLFEQEFGLQRQFLNSQELKFVHPTSKKELHFIVDFPKDLLMVLDGLRKINDH